ncbi:TonB family C-terminal domain-containing protein [Tenacibaculum sp. MAR_2009_124]|uniref:energy transducer TonB n=1 Tax=Tenacibaculum sp. MAR_2009_124 TaxID=1250059 RepID=UPI00089C27A2|nr:energy transducer TonB [Tenacibaculum sp. MAR_2009_124]SEB41068.1 TonB family C-terminal domain-containing protein [Tenacibaculum sp. MAR_2009_124]
MYSHKILKELGFISRTIMPLLFSFIVQQNFSQHCSEENEEQTDLNSISLINKCKTVEDNKSTSKVFSLNTRYLKRRKNSKNRNLLAEITDNTNNHNSVKSIELANIKKNITSLVTSIIKTSKENTISFSEVDSVPIFSNCNENSEDQYNCFNDKMQEHINNNFTYPKEALDYKIEGVIQVSFVINKEGNVTNIETISFENTELLKKEAVRIVSMLPQFIPGKNDNKNVNVAYSFPMEFKINSSNQF